MGCAKKLMLEWLSHYNQRENSFFEYLTQHFFIIHDPYYDDDSTQNNEW